jgi:hypothetical protein
MMKVEIIINNDRDHDESDKKTSSRYENILANTVSKEENHAEKVKKAEETLSTEQTTAKCYHKADSELDWEHYNVIM